MADLITSLLDDTEDHTEQNLTWSVRSLIDSCKNAADILDNYNKENNRHITGSLSGIELPSDAPVAIIKARTQLQDASLRLQTMTADPRGFISGLATSIQKTACMRWLCTFQIMSFVPDEGSLSFTDVARCADVPEAQLKSISRLAMLFGIFQQPTPGEISHSPLSRRFAHDTSLYEWVLFHTEIGGPTARYMVEATQKWGKKAKKEETAISIHFKSTKPLFDHFASHPELGKQFAAYMKHASEDPWTSPIHVVRGYDWNSLGAGHVIDVGGSNCHITIALAENFSGLRFTVQDLPTTVVNSYQIVNRLDAHIASRISLQAYDFFEMQPVVDADVYFFRTIFHDWSDDDAAKILRTQKLAMSRRPSARLLIMDIVLPNEGEAGIFEETLSRVQDLKMMQCFNAHERSMGDWLQLLDQANQEEESGRAIAPSSTRFILHRVTKPIGSLYSILEIGLTEETATLNTSE